MLTNPKPAGWAAFDQITHVEMTSIGEQLPFAVDGNAGGVYAPTDPIEIGGDGLEVSGPFLASSTMQVNGDATLSGDVLFDGPSFTCSTVVATFNSGTTFTDAVVIQGTLTLQDEVILSGGAAVRERVTFAANSNATLTYGTVGTVHVFQSGVVTAGRTITLNNASNTGARIRLVNYTAFAMPLLNQSAGALLAVPGSEVPANSTVIVCWLNNGGYTGWSAI